MYCTLDGPVIKSTVFVVGDSGDVLGISEILVSKLRIIAVSVLARLTAEQFLIFFTGWNCDFRCRSAEMRV
jgi:hypothetical protein